MKKFIFIALVLWLVAESAYQLWIVQMYQNEGHFNWASYAYDRNQSAINQLYNISANQLSQRLFVEVRNGLIRDTTGTVPLPVKKLILKLAKDIEPEGHFY